MGLLVITCLMVSNAVSQAAVHTNDVLFGQSSN